MTATSPERTLHPTQNPDIWYARSVSRPGIIYWLRLDGMSVIHDCPGKALGCWHSEQGAAIIAKRRYAEMQAARANVIAERTQMAAGAPVGQQAKILTGGLYG